MKRLLIVGASNFGREVLDWALSIPATQRNWEVVGFLDNRPDILAPFSTPYPILDAPETYTIQPEDCFICAVGDPQARLQYATMLSKRGATFINILHPTAIISPSAHLGIGCILCPGVVIGANATIGNFVVLNTYSTIGHDASLGDGCTINSHCDVTGWAKLEEGVFMGSHASILPHIVAQAYAVIGAGSVAIRNVPAHQTVVGVPAKRI